MALNDKSSGRADAARRMTASEGSELTLPTQRSHRAPEIQRKKADIAGRVAKFGRTLSYGYALTPTAKMAAAGILNTPSS